MDISLETVENWHSQPVENSLTHASAATSTILEKALSGVEISQPEAVLLFESSVGDLRALLHCADELRRRVNGDEATFVITRNINFTNVCYMGCHFCNFGKRLEDAEAELLSFEEVAHRTNEAATRGATEVCIQGGLHPQIKGTHYREIVQAVKTAQPEMHVHAFSPFEIQYGARKSKLSPEEFLADLKAAGLGSVPGTAAEILHPEVRQKLTQDKLSTDEWVRMIRAAHSVGLKSTATIMYGHVDEPRHWAHHFEVIRNIQHETQGFTEFVPLGFVHYDSPLYNNFDGVRPGPTTEEHLKMHAIARIFFHGSIENIQASWVKMGPEFAQLMLRCGVNDLGGTLMNESISRASGAKFGQEVTPTEMVELIRGVNLRPVRRSTLYVHLEHYSLRKSEPERHLVPILY